MSDARDVRRNRRIVMVKRILFLLLPSHFYVVSEGTSALNMSDERRLRAHLHSAAPLSEQSFLLNNHKLLGTLMEGYDPGLSPYNTHSAKTKNSLSDEPPGEIDNQLIFVRLIRVEEREQQIYTVLVILSTWRDPRLLWDPSEFGGIDHIYLQADRIWHPEVAACDSSAYVPVLPDHSVFVKVNSTGHVITDRAYAVTYTCEFDIAYFPFDKQKCRLCFFLPIYKESELRVEGTYSEDLVVLDTPEWQLGGFNVETQYKKEFQLELLFYNITMTRRSEFWVKMIIAPTFLIGCLILVGLLISVEDEARSTAVNLGLTTMMSMTVILGILSDSIPKSKDLPVLGYFILYEIIIIEVAVITVIYGKLSKNLKKFGSKLGAIVKSKIDEDNEEAAPSEAKSTFTVRFFVFLFFIVLHFLNLGYLLSYYHGCIYPPASVTNFTRNTLHSLHSLLVLSHFASGISTRDSGHRNKLSIVIDGNIEWTFNKLSFLVAINPYMQMTIGSVSLLISFILFYVFVKAHSSSCECDNAIGGMHSSSGVLLNDDTTNSTLSSSTVIFTGPLRQINAFGCTILFAKEPKKSRLVLQTIVPNKVVDCHVAPSSEEAEQLLGETLERRVTCSLIFDVIWSAISMFAAIDYSILGTSFSIFVILYLAQILHLNRGVWVQLNEVNLLMSILNIRPQLKSSISPRPWEILHHTSRLFLGIAIQPIVSFVIPTSKSMNEFDQESVYYLLHLCSFTQLRSRISRFAHSSQSLRMDNTHTLHLFNVSLLSPNSNLIQNLPSPFHFHYLFTFLLHLHLRSAKSFRFSSSLLNRWE
ncbi:hypothetical protein PRIPAC_79926 [Pristionchus pacificus]|uniref:Transmembrane ion channel n=1 Tax=Pristionchus pacificus TaxID=54126 RepID=A0A2A6CL24_PRIPA|nr:hypothetical protein PRIPAC_79926 [Pristionchus pacificus]|eukprot:PDM78902.1 transmembrane ion channel [Pristionchus pacificus]